MQTTFALAALAAVAYAAPQSNTGGTAVTSLISPAGAEPSGAMSSYSGDFEVTIVNITSSPSKREVEKRQSSTCGMAGYLTVSLSNGVLTDSAGRRGYIASNYQFQFDNPPQAGAIYTAGWSVLTNGSLALGPSAVFYSCYTGGFSNLYSVSIGAQCDPILIDILPCASTSTTEAGVSQTTDGQIQATATGNKPVSQISDGQIQATTTGAAISQISDGQIQVPTGVPVSQISDGQIQATSAAKTTATGAPVSQISDGQIQATSAAKTTATGAPVSQISDGQIQATSAAKTTATGAPVSQISDGQIQATSAASMTTTKATGAPVSQISDGQIQATAASNSSTPVTFTGAGNVVAAAGSVAGAVVLGALALLL